MLGVPAAHGSTRRALRVIRGLTKGVAGTGGRQASRGDGGATGRDRRVPVEREKCLRQPQNSLHRPMSGERGGTQRRGLWCGFRCGETVEGCGG